MSQITKFNLKSISFPKMDCIFFTNPGEKFDVLFRAEANIASPQIVQILFGIKATSAEVLDTKQPKAYALVEAIAEFEFPDTIPNCKHLSDLPHAGNMLAIIFPFLREKIASFFMNNNVVVLLPPLNIIQLLEDNRQNDAFQITDSRKTETPESEQVIELK